MNIKFKDKDVVELIEKMERAEIFNLIRLIGIALNNMEGEKC